MMFVLSNGKFLACSKVSKWSEILNELHEKIAFENIVGKEEHVGDQYFLLFPQCFHQIQNCRLDSLEECKILLFGIEFIVKRDCCPVQ